jgi:hypothetical protein
MTVDVLVTSIVGDGMGVKVTVGDAGVGLVVSVARIVGGRMTIVAAGAGVLAGSAHPESRRIRMRDMVKEIFIVIYLYIFDARGE